MYKNIIFDIGNVLLSFKPEEFLKLKLNNPEKVLEVHREVFQSEEWIMLDRGTITEEEAVKVIADRSASNSHLIPLAFDNWYDILTPIEGTVEILRKLKNSGYKLFFLSNFHLLAFEYILEKYDFFKLFHGGVVSYEEKLIKPEDRIYKRLLEKYELKAEECIFIDDVYVNIEGAGRAGLNTILFKDPEDLTERLKESGINL
jgi:putative hydrolase of the HAD superfamily